VLFIGTPVINFAVVMIVGVISGTFTSSCISPGLLVAWQKKQWGTFSSKSNGPIKAASEALGRSE
jgi:preprotein translocase subunit SecF